MATREKSGNPVKSFLARMTPKTLRRMKKSRSKSSLDSSQIKNGTPYYTPETKFVAAAAASVTPNSETKVSNGTAHAEQNNNRGLVEGKKEFEVKAKQDLQEEATFLEKVDDSFKSIKDLTRPENCNGGEKEDSSLEETAQTTSRAVKEEEEASSVQEPEKSFSWGFVESARKLLWKDAPQSTDSPAAEMPSSNIQEGKDMLPQNNVDLLMDLEDDGEIDWRALKQELLETKKFEAYSVEEIILSIRQKMGNKKDPSNMLHHLAFELAQLELSVKFLDLSNGHPSRPASSKALHQFLRKNDQYGMISTLLPLALLTGMSVAWFKYSK